MRTVWVFQHDDAEPAGLIQTVLKRRLDLTFVTFRPDQKPLPPKLSEDCSALIVMGGPMGVYQQDAFPWIAAELALIREAIDSARPVLGICLGSQLLAAAAGANVYKGDTQKELGWAQVKLTPEGFGDPLAKFLANPVTGEATTVFQWHGDTFDLPPGAVLLATSTRYPQQAFRAGRVAYGFQFHFEVTEQIVRQWAQLWHREMAEEGVTTEDLFSGLKEHLPLLNRRGEEIVRAFGTLIDTSPLRAVAATTQEDPAARRRRRRIEPRLLDGPWNAEEKSKTSGS
jgi:GMP synthase (glutamine-hydrolysing)